MTAVVPFSFSPGFERSLSRFFFVNSQVMSKRRKILLLILAALLLLGVVLIFATGGADGDSEEVDQKEHKVLSARTEDTYRAVPSDAVLIFDFEQLDHLSPILKDTSVFSYGLIDSTSALVRFQDKLFGFGEGNCHSLFSLHYSAVNEVSLLQIADLDNPENVSKIQNYLESSASASRNYNSHTIYTLPSGLKAALYKDRVLASSSAICVESSLRHLDAGTSILDNQEFYSVLRGTGGDECLYVNHKQIGKLFSGSVTYSFLKYSDFVMRMATWSALEINPRQRNFISFEGSLTDHSDYINYAAVLGGQKAYTSMAQGILPASTMFAVCLDLHSLKNYVKDYEKYLDANKKYSSYLANLDRIPLPDAPSPMEWLTSEGFTEAVSAFCLVGGKYEWVTLLYRNSTSWLGKITGIKGRGETKEPEEFIFKGYVAGVLGEAFSHNPETSCCKISDWTIIGSANAITEFSKGRANAVTLDRYLSHTPVSSFFSEKGVAKAFVNIKEGSDTLLTVLNKYYRGRIESSLRKKNFEYATVNVFPDKGGTKASLSFYAARLTSPPQMFDVEDEEVVFIDSTFKTFWGPFPLVDPERGDTTWFEQSKKYLSISYMDRNKKGIWGIPMKDTIKNYAGLVKLEDGKSYITFILGDKLYRMSRKGAHYTGYPKQLDVEVALGPMLITENGQQRMFIITGENIITKRNVNGDKVEGWTDIHAPEFTREMPEEVVLFGHRYYVLRTVSKLRIYTTGGEELTAKNIKRPISRESTITEDKDGFVKVMGLDGKEFLFNLKNGRIKKL